MSTFIYITKDYRSDSCVIKKSEVGIIISKDESTSEIQFVNTPNAITLPNSIIKEFDPDKTGDQFALKVCNRCNRLLPTENFEKNQNGKGDRSVRRPSCSSCRDSIDGKNINPSIKKKWNKTKPNMIIWECPICKKRTIPGLTSKVVLDHNHKTGTPNAWICDSCNTGLGRFKDDTEVMTEAINYLKKYQE